MKASYGDLESALIRRKLCRRRRVTTLRKAGDGRSGLALIGPALDGTGPRSPRGKLPNKCAVTALETPGLPRAPGVPHNKLFESVTYAAAMAARGVARGLRMT